MSVTLGDPVRAECYTGGSSQSLVLHWGIKSELSVTLVDPVIAECYNGGSRQGLVLY